MEPGQPPIRKTADKLNDFLRSPQARPDLQTPEAQEWLNFLEQNYHSPQTDAMMPWMTREWKKGRITMPQGGGNSVRVQAVPAAWRDGQQIAPPEFVAIPPTAFNHWADFYNSDHPIRRGMGDIMQLQTHDFREKLHEWDAAMYEEAQKARNEQKGEVVHHWPDGWTLQKLNEDMLKAEGETMGHCVGGYGNAVRNGSSLIYSLRDPDNQPHVTMEIHPKNWVDESGEVFLHNPYDGELEGAWPIPHEGEMVQIQGKGNQAPKPEYQQRIKDWVEKEFENPKDRPTWEDQDISDVDEICDGDGYTAYHGGDYGLEKPYISHDWEQILDSMADRWEEPWRGWNGDPEQVAEWAFDHDEGEELKRALEEYVHDAENSCTSYIDHEFDYDPIGTAENHGYEFHEDEPQPEDFNDADGEFDEAEYEEALDEWKDRRQEWADEIRDDIKREAWNNDERQYLYDALYSAIRRQEINRRTHTSAKKRFPHKHFSTGEDCKCTFTRHLGGWKTANDAPKCDVCGDELTDGVWCKRCEWGHNDWSDAPDKNPVDPTKDFKGIQAGVWGWDDAEQEWEDWMDKMDRQREQASQYAWEMDPGEFWNQPQPHVPQWQAPDHPPQFLPPAERESVIKQVLDLAWGDLKMEPSFSVPQIQRELPGELIQRGVAPDIANEVAQEWGQKATEWYDHGRTDMTVPQEWTARVARRYSTRPPEN